MGGCSLELSQWAPFAQGCREARAGANASCLSLVAHEELFWGTKSQVSWSTGSYRLLAGHNVGLVEMRGIAVESQGLWKDGSQELLAGQNFGLVRMRVILWKPGGDLHSFSLVGVSEGSHNWTLLVSPSPSLTSTLPVL